MRTEWSTTPRPRDGWPLASEPRESAGVLSLPRGAAGWGISLQPQNDFTYIKN